MSLLSSIARQRFLSLAWVVPLLAFALACGAAEAPTPTATTPPAPTATSTPAPAPTATSTPVSTAAAPGPVATPTPTAVATPTPIPAEQPKRGGTMNIIEGSTPAHFDPYLGYSPTFQHYLGKAYNNLFVNYEGSKIDCEICSEAGWRLEDGGKTMVFNIKPGIKFRNGNELTSKDVAYSINMMMGLADGFVSARVGWIKEYVEKIETPSNYELRIKLLRPSLVVPKILSTSFAMILPQGTTRDDLKLGKPLLGSGPFLLQRFQADAGATYERNPNYFKPGLPYLDRVEFTVAADTNTRWAAFYTHRFEYVGVFEEPQEQFLVQLFKLRDESKIKIIPYYVGGFNGIYIVGSKAPFTDIRLRQAINLAMDRTAAGKAMFGDRSVPQLMMFMSGEDFGTPEAQIWNVVPGWGTGAKKQQEIEEAKKLVKDAGYPDGMDIKQFNSTRYNIGYPAGSELVQAMIKPIGIRTTMDYARDGVDHVARTANLDYLFQSYAAYRISGDPDEPIGQYQVTGGSRNYAGYSNREVDRLFVLMSSESDIGKRKQLFFQIQDIILKDLWYAPWPWHPGAFYYWPSLGGVGVDIGLTPAFTSGHTRADRYWMK